MSILAWILLGLLAGFIGSKIVNKSGEGVIVDILLGIVGAVLGGWLFNRFGAAGVTGLNLYSLLVAVVGSVVFLVIYHQSAGCRNSAGCPFPGSQSTDFTACRVWQRSMIAETSLYITH
jgi:uncharacterized membrane protein YeaQ/YmgE (transglycosylase-associated protein family)